MAFALLWVFFSTWLVLSGWFLSEIRSLNATGYIFSLLLFGIACLVLSKWGIPGRMTPVYTRLRRRFKRGLPLVYLICLGCAFFGGAIYSPNNYDGICYRIPRLLHWLDQGHWHWMDTWNARMDYSATGFEWLMAPSLALFHTERLFFLTNIFSYALLPGLLYSTYVGLGVSRRVAWYWMWILPTGYCFAIQAGSIGNDSFSVVYFLAALALGLRAARESDIKSAVGAILAAGLLTGAKATNIPLLLPIVIALAPALFLLHRRWAILAAAVVVAAMVSYLPIAILNTFHTGDWSGDPTNSGKMKISSPIAGMAGNTLEVSVGCLMPPVFPFVESWNKKAEYLTQKVFYPIRQGFPRLSLATVELPSEESAGLGIGVATLIFISLMGGLFFSKNSIRSRFGLFVGICCWGALLVYMAKMGSECAARLLAPYYPGLVVPLLLLTSQSTLVRQKWWRFLAFFAAVAVLPALLLSPSRPLIPVQIALDLGERVHFPRSVIERARTVYLRYGNRIDNLAVVREQIPKSAKTIGFAGTADESEISFWKPFGTRRVVDLKSRSRPVANIAETDAVVGSAWGIQDRFGMSPSDFAHQIGGKIVWRAPVATRAGAGPIEWILIMPQKEDVPFR